MAFEVELTKTAVKELKALRPFEQRRIVGEIESQLPSQPTTPTRNRKELLGLTPGFEHRPPVWELRIGDYRVFYDIDLEAQKVYVRAVRHKGPEQTTEDVVS